MLLIITFDRDTPLMRCLFVWWLQSMSSLSRYFDISKERTIILYRLNEISPRPSCLRNNLKEIFNETSFLAFVSTALTFFFREKFECLISVNYYFHSLANSTCFEERNIINCFFWINYTCLPDMPVLQAAHVAGGVKRCGKKLINH